MGFGVWRLFFPCLLHLTIFCPAGSPHGIMHTSMVSFPVHVFGLRFSIFGSFKFPLVLWTYLPFLPLILNLPFPLTDCIWFTFPGWFLGDVFTDLEILKLSSLSFSTTVVRATICSCSGDITFQFTEASRNSYLLSADVTSLSDVMSSFSL